MHPRVRKHQMQGGLQLWIEAGGGQGSWVKLCTEMVQAPHLKGLSDKGKHDRFICQDLCFKTREQEVRVCFGHCGRKQREQETKKKKDQDIADPKPGRHPKS